MASGLFYPYLRSGLATVADADRRAQINLILEEDGELRDLPLSLPLAGPGDVVGIASDAIRRVVPQPGTSDHRAGAFPFVEFHNPAFPWTMSPDTPVGDRLLPYLALLCLPEAETTIIQHGAGPLPKIFARNLAAARPEDTESDGTFLPRPEDFALAAHVHDPDGRAGDKEPGPSAFSRLLSLQRLVVGRGYHAVLVPLFAAGREAGLGRNVPGDASFSWAAEDDSVELPIYHHWKFRAGPSRGVEDLLRDLRAFSPTGQAAQPGKLTVDSNFVGAAYGLDGREVRLRTIFNPLEPPGLVEENALLGALAEANGNGVLAHPSYGRVHADSDASQGGPQWYRDCNLDLSLRLLAGTGGAIVRDRQEEIVGFVRQSAGPLDEVNAVLSRAHAAMLGNAGLYHAVAGASDPQAAVLFAGPAAERLAMLQGGVIALDEALEGTREEQAIDPATRALAGTAALSVVPAIEVEMRNTELADDIAGGAIKRRDFDALLVSARRNGPVATATERADVRDFLAKLVDPPPGQGVRADGDDPGLVFWEKTTGEDRLRPGRRRGPPGHADAGSLSSEIVHRLDPGVSVPPRIRSRIAGLDDGLGPLPARVVIEPVWPRPLVSEMLRTAPEFLAPGLDRMPSDSIAGMRYDAAAMEAIMVGANHELQRELRWRGVSAARHASPVRRAFGRFEAAGMSEHDITPIAAWGDTHIGTHQEGGGLDFVAILRSPLIRRFPETVITLVKAIRRDADKPRELDPDTAQVLPAIIGTLAGDLSYVGFPPVNGTLRGDSARNDEGWFLLFSQTGDESQFGLNAPTREPARAPASLGRWGDLSWTDVGKPVISAADFTRDARSDLSWGADAAQMAAILFEQPTIVALHLSDLLP